MESDTTRGVPASSSPPQLEELYSLMSGYRVSQAIYVAAKIGIADLMEEGPRGSDELAQETGTHAATLYRVLRFLAGVGLFDEVAPRRFALTPLGAGLRTDLPGSIRPMALMLLDPASWQPWGQLLYSVQTGGTAFEHVHGVGRFDYLTQHPDTAAVFNEAMSSNTARSGSAITEAYDFSGIKRLVDVGGGHGLLLATILGEYPTMRGVLFDRHQVIAGAQATLEAAGVSDRCELVSGDFFAEVPSGGDAYLLRQIIHDWDDARALTILRNCRQAISKRGRLLVVERAISSEYRRALPVLHVDLEMLVNVGGQERTDAEYHSLFGTAGFELTSIVPLGDAAQFSVFEGVPV